MKKIIFLILLIFFVKENKTQDKDLFNYIDSSYFRIFPELDKYIDSIFVYVYPDSIKQSDGTRYILLIIKNISSKYLVTIEDVVIDIDGLSNDTIGMHIWPRPS